MLKLGFNAFLGAAVTLGMVGAAQADRSEGPATARKGVVRCGGTNHVRQGGTEIHTTNYNLRNFDAAQSITIDRLRFFDATGTGRDAATGAVLDERSRNSGGCRSIFLK